MHRAGGRASLHEPAAGCYGEGFGRYDTPSLLRSSAAFSCCSFSCELRHHEAQGSHQANHLHPLLGCHPGMHATPASLLLSRLTARTRASRSATASSTALPSGVCLDMASRYDPGICGHVCGTKRGSRSRGEHSDMREVEGHPNTHSHAHTSSSPPAPLPPQPLQQAPHRSHHRLVLGSVLQSRRGPSVVWQEREVSGTPCCSWAASSMTASHAPSEPV